jgi:hypothetical protein
MQKQNFIRPGIFFTAVVAVLIIGLLLWQHFHGGVPSHHILNEKNLPKISNWWGGLLLPVLTGFLVYRIESRIIKQEALTQQPKNQNIKIAGLFFLGLFFGIVLAVSFVNDYTIFLDNVIYILIILAFLVPIFNSEFILGFILGMTYTFGALLPTVFILVIAAFGFLIYRFIRPLFLRLIKIGEKKAVR